MDLCYRGPPVLARGSEDRKGPNDYRKCKKKTTAVELFPPDRQQFSLGERTFFLLSLSLSLSLSLLFRGVCLACCDLGQEQNYFIILEKGKSCMSLDLKRTTGVTKLQISRSLDGFFLQPYRQYLSQMMAAGLQELL